MSRLIILYASTQLIFSYVHFDKSHFICVKKPQKMRYGQIRQVTCFLSLDRFNPALFTTTYMHVSCFAVLSYALFPSILVFYHFRLDFFSLSSHVIHFADYGCRYALSYDELIMQLPDAFLALETHTRISRRDCAVVLLRFQFSILFFRVRMLA